MLRLSRMFTSRLRNESNPQDEKHLSGCSQSESLRSRIWISWDLSQTLTPNPKSQILIVRRKKVLGGRFFICRGLMPSTSYRWLALDGGCRCRLCSIRQAAPAKGLSCREGCRYIQRISIQIKCWYCQPFNSKYQIGFNFSFWRWRRGVEKL